MKTQIGEPIKDFFGRDVTVYADPDVPNVYIDIMLDGERCSITVLDPYTAVDLGTLLVKASVYPKAVLS